jgi:UDP-2,3-diacylglucosamine pyrophosphatase LpxH
MASLAGLSPLARSDRPDTAPPARRVPLSVPPAWFYDPVPDEPRRDRLQFRTVWISDAHLGTAGCNADLLLDFLRSVDCDTLYLVGDMVDGWALRKGWYWPQTHNEIVRCILKQTKNGTRVVYLPGNHDEAFRDFVGLSMGGIELLPEAIHVTADGRRLLILHGDQFDGVVLYARWLAFLGDYAYEFLLKGNRLVNWVRRRFGMPYWSLAAFLTKRVKTAVQFICSYEEAVIHAAADAKVDGVVCGHIHSAEIRQFGDITYYNDGDWVESCTALVEHADGTMEILDWAARKRGERTPATARVTAA